MRLYIGSFDEDEVNEVVEDLRKAGVRSELRHALNIEISEKYYLEGKISELKEKYKERKRVMKVIEGIEDYFEKARQIMKDGIETKEFEEKFLDSIIPERKEFEEMKKEMEKEKDLDKAYSELLKKFGEEKTDEFIDEIMYEFKLTSFFHSLLEKNGIEYKEGKMYGKIAEDPYVKIYLEGDAPKDLPHEMKVFIHKNVDLYANLIDVIYETKRIEKLAEEKKEYTPLLFAATIVAKIMDKIQNKMEVEELIQKSMHFKENGDEIILSEDAVKEIIKMLEKAEIIRVKKGKVILKERKKR
ncbi:MAG: hypothetical protein FE044_00485 [Thermoplasmata archaeon]|nr:MAG: hypothetical protein FE044_00485 [Thermoplasmata archaeon]